MKTLVTSFGLLFCLLLIKTSKLLSFFFTFMPIISRSLLLRRSISFRKMDLQYRVTNSLFSYFHQGVIPIKKNTKHWFSQRSILLYCVSNTLKEIEKDMSLLFCKIRDLIQNLYCPCLILRWFNFNESNITLAYSIFKLTLILNLSLLLYINIII